MIWKTNLRKNNILYVARPSNQKHSAVRGRIVPLIEQWQRICILSERIIKRREAAAVRSPALRRAFLPTHFTLLDLSPSSTTVPLPGSPPSMTGSLTQSFLGFDITGLIGSQGDLSRLTNTLRSVVEVNENCWRGDDCELSNGVRSGLEQLAAHAQRHSEISELRVRHGLFSFTIVDSLAVKGPSRHHARVSEGETPFSYGHSLL